MTVHELNGDYQITVDTLKQYEGRRTFYLADTGESLWRWFEQFIKSRGPTLVHNGNYLFNASRVLHRHQLTRVRFDSRSAEFTFTRS